MKSGTRFSTLDEFYKAVNNLAEWLKREGHLGEAQKIDSLMHTAWTTGSELLGELSLALNDMNGAYSSELRNEIDQCLEFASHHRKILRL